MFKMSPPTKQPLPPAYPKSDDDDDAPPSSTSRRAFREHSPPRVANLDMPFPYPSTLVPSSSAPLASPEHTLAFFLESTNEPDAQALQRHAERIQEEAYATWPYPCIRRWAFLTTKAAKSPVYPSVLSIGRNDPSAIYLDLGCFTGTDSRKVVADGWPAARVIGSDLRREWFELGWKLYGDKERCGVTFLAGDVFDEAFLATSEEHDDDDGGDEEEEATRLSEKASSTSSPDLRSLRSLNPLRGRIRCISAFSFFHLFDREPQLVLARKLAALLGPRARPGSVIFGSHQGMRVPGNRRGPGQSELFGHSPESWKELWECDVFPGSRRSGEQGVKVKVWAEFKEDGLPKMEVQLDRNKDGADNMPEQVAASSQSQLMQWSVTVV